MLTFLWKIVASVCLCVVLSDVSNISFSQYNVHVLTSVMKSFFREMKEPLMTFVLYSDFIGATGLVCCIRVMLAAHAAVCLVTVCIFDQQLLLMFASTNGCVFTSIMHIVH